MLAKYKKISNIAAGASIASVAIVFALGPRNGGLWHDEAQAVLWGIFTIGIWVAFWAYAKAKGRSGWLGILLPLLSILGLIILICLKDKSPAGAPGASQ